MWIGHKLRKNVKISGVLWWVPPKTAYIASCNSEFVQLSSIKNLGLNQDPFFDLYCDNLGRMMKIFIMYYENWCYWQIWIWRIIKREWWMQIHSPLQPNLIAVRTVVDPSACGWDLAECGWDLADCGWDQAECGWVLAERGWDLAECGWDLAGCGWDLAECGWDLAECGWYLAECGWDLAECG